MYEYKTRVMIKILRSRINRRRGREGRDEEWKCGGRKERTRSRIEINRERRVKEIAMGNNNKQNIYMRGPLDGFA